MKRDAWTFGRFIPGSVSSVADLFHTLWWFLVYSGGVFNCLNKYNEPKTPYLCTLALTKFFVGIFITQPIRLGGQRCFCPAQTWNRSRTALTRKKFPSKEGVQHLTNKSQAEQIYLLRFNILIFNIFHIIAHIVHSVSHD
jgi:hypothetical protein